MITSHFAYTLIDMGATHSCMTEEYMSACNLTIDILSDHVMCINTSSGSGSMMTRLVKYVDVIVEGPHMLVDMLMLPMSKFDVILSMNWLNKCCVTIDCRSATLSFRLEDQEVEHELVR